MRHLADNVLDGDLTRAMSDNVERISAQVARRAPVDLSNLRASAHPTVHDGAALVYDRAPTQHRLTDEELAALSRSRNRRR